MNNYYQSKVEQLYQLIKAQKIIRKTTCAEFGSIVEKIAKKELGIDKVKTKYVKLNKNTNGICYENLVQINIDNIKFALATLANSIFHEFKHIHQNNHPISKKINKAKENNFVAQYIPDSTNYYLNLKDLKISSYDLYYISQREYDARKYAFEMTDKLLKDLKEVYKNDENRNGATKIYLDAQISLNNEQYKIETKKYDLSMKKVQSKKDLLEKVMLFEVKKLLNNYGNSSKIVVNDNRMIASQEVGGIRFITSVFCNEQIKEEVLKKARKENDPFLFSTIINSPFCKVDENLLNECFELFSKNNYSFAEIPQYLTNWDKQQLKTIWDNKEKSLCE